MSEASEFLKAALNSLREPLFLLDKSRRCLFANEALYRFLGLDVATSPKIQTEYFWPDIGDFVRFQDEMTLEFRVRDGDTYLVKLVSRPTAGEITMFRVVSGQSKSDPLNTFHGQRLETLGLLAGGVAHDFNNILTGILGHTTYLKTILPQSGPHVESLNAIEDGTRKGSSITQQILNFSKLDSSSTAAQVDVGDLILRTCTLLRRAISPQYSLETDVSARSIKILCIESQLAQILVNLVFNARDAIENQGKIEVCLSCTDDKELLSEAFGGFDLSSEQYAVLSVTDTGHGMPAELQLKIFEPYFSTKKEKGTGLGLSTVASIVRSLGGTIKVNSVVGVGTQIVLYLPAVSEEATTETTQGSQVPHLCKGTERILVVDDEYPVRNVLVVSLQHLGYSVESAGSGAEALEIFQRESGNFDLIIMDMLMPNMSGEQLFFELKKLQDDVPVLVISGFTSEESIRSVLTNGGKGFVPKPFTIDELSRRVRGCLDGES